MKFLINLFLIFGLTPLAYSQQRPTLTTEDVIKWRAANPEKAAHYIPKDGNRGDVLPQPSTQPDAEFPAREKDWNMRLTQAKQRVQDFERKADQAEIAAAQSRNTVFHNSPDGLNASNTTIHQTREAASLLRREAQLAQENLHQLLDEGRQNGYQLTFIEPRLKNGEPNLEYYRTRFLELQAELQDAQNRSVASQLRTNRIQTSINQTFGNAGYVQTPRRGFLYYPNNGAADAFYLNRLRNELAVDQSNLRNSTNRIAILETQLNELIEEGRRAGVPPGIFR